MLLSGQVDPQPENPKLCGSWDPRLPDPNPTHSDLKIMRSAAVMNLASSCSVNCTIVDVRTNETRKLRVQTRSCSGAGVGLGICRHVARWLRGFWQR